MSRILLGLMVINWVVEMRFPEKFRRIFRERKRRTILLFLVFYLLYLIGLLYSTNMQYGRFDIEVKLSLGIVPLLFATLDPRVFRHFRLEFLFGLYVAGCLFNAIFCLINGYLEFIQTGDPGVFYYSRFSVLHHTSYFAMFINMAVAIVLFYLWHRFRNIPGWAVVGLLLLLTGFNEMLVLLSSKMGLLTMMVIYGGYMALMLWSREGRKRLWMPAGLLATLILFSWTSPATMHRVETSTRTVGAIDTLSTNNQESTGERILIWRSSLEIIRENPLLGVGTGDVKDALLAQYAREGIKYAYIRNLDAHNQYLQTYLSLGITGFLYLVLMLAIPGVMSLIRRDYIYLFFIVLFSMNLLVESMFENQAGVVFYAFLNALLFWYSPVSGSAPVYEKISRDAFFRLDSGKQ